MLRQIKFELFGSHGNRMPSTYHLMPGYWHATPAHQAWQAMPRSPVVPCSTVSAAKCVVSVHTAWLWLHTLQPGWCLRAWL